MKRIVAIAEIAFLALIAFSAGLSAAHDSANSSWSGTYRGRVLTELFIQEQARNRSHTALTIEQPLRLLSDNGHIAVIEASNGVVTQPNFLDLQGASIVFSPTTDGYLGESRPVEFDQTARDNGTPLALGDDDSQRVTLPFVFPFFGVSRSDVFVNSDGNLTFNEGDAGTETRSLSRAVAGAPRIAPLFADLNPAADASQVRAYVAGDRVVFTWDGIPQFGSSRRHVFQAALYSDGSIAFHYRSVDLSSVVVGLFPGGGLTEPTPVDLSGAFAVGPNGAAELFQILANLDPMTAARRFYASHDDAYDFIFLFNNFGLSPGPGTFAYELNVRNDIVGIGDVLVGQETFDLGAEFGSQQRLSSFLNMGSLSVYPDNPHQVIPVIGENTTLSVMGQEAGHRWGVYTQFLDPETNQPSDALLGRGDAHWNFFFNSQGSVIEGNDIQDAGVNVNPRFKTGPPVVRYGEFDQYIMGLRSPEEVAASFLVAQPQGSGNTNPGRIPQSGVNFNGIRKDIPIDAIIAAEGARTPNASMAQRSFNFAFVLLVDAGATPPTAVELEKLDRIRREWENFFEQATGGRAEATTELQRALHLSVWPRAGVPVGKTVYATVRIEKPLDRDVSIVLNSDSSDITIPPVVTIPKGRIIASLPITGTSPGTAVLRATAFSPGLSGFDSPSAHIKVIPADALLDIAVVSGGAQIGAIGTALAQPIVVRITDQERTPIGNVSLIAVASGNGSAALLQSPTGPDGRVKIAWTLANTPGPQTLTLRTPGASSAKTITAEAVAGLPVFPSGGVVNAANMNAPGISPGSIASVFGVNLAPAVASVTGFPLPRTLAGVQLFVNGVPAPLYYVSPHQINFQVPYSLTSTTASIQILSSAGASMVETVPVLHLQPGLFRSADDGTGAMRFHLDGLTARDRAAHAGEAIELFTTGLGEVIPAPELGEPASGFVLAKTVAVPSVSIGGRTLPATFSGLAPGLAGLYQINFILPTDLLPGRYEVLVLIDGIVSNTVLLDVD